MQMKRFALKLALLSATIVVIALASTAAQSPGVTYVAADKVAATLAKGGSLATAPGLTVSGLRRMGPGQVEVHDTESDIFYVVDGAATIVTGGTMVGGKQTAANQQRGTDIQGGETRRLQKGDVIVIPAGVPHWFKEVSPTINYLTVKVIKQ